MKHAEDHTMELSIYTKAMGLGLDETQIDLISRYAQLLVSHNKDVNLISRLDTEGTIVAHIISSLSILQKVSIPECLKVLDLGTGGGLPGIPLAIVRPDLKLTLLDSVRKKTRIVESILDELGLSIQTISSRVEELQVTHMRSFDIVIARAVAPLFKLIKWAKPLLNTNVFHSTDSHGERDKHLIRPGSIIAMKGGDLKLEIQEAIAKTGETLIEEISLDSEPTEQLGMMGKRAVIVEVRGT